MGRDSTEQIEVCRYLFYIIIILSCVFYVIISHTILYFQDLSLLQESNYNDTPITDDDKAQYSKTDLTNNEATYTIEFKEKGILKETYICFFSNFVLS